MTPWSPVNAACAYYLGRTAKNVALQAARAAKVPRNIFACAVAILFVLTIWFVVSRGMQQSQAHPEDVIAFVRGKVIPLHPIALIYWLDALFTALPIVGGIGSLARTLAFTRAELEFLFQAPLTLRQIVYFKVAATVYPAVLQAVPLAAILAALYPDASFGRAFLGLALANGVLQMLRVALHSSASYLAGKRIGYLVPVFATVVVAAFCYTVFHAFAEARTVFGGLAHFTETPAFQWLVLPMDFVLAPAYSASWVHFLQALWQPLIVAAALSAIAFVPRFSFSYFAEAFGYRAEPEVSPASARPATAMRWLRLRPTGPQWSAIVWKNLKANAPRNPAAALVRTALGLAVLTALWLAPLSDGYQAIISVLLSTVILGVIAVGPWIIRTGGLRSDMPHFDLLKSMPISGRQLLFGQVIVQLSILLTFVLAAAVVLALRDIGFSPVVLLICVGLLAARVTVHNLFALYFPALVQLDPARKSDDHRFIVRAAVSVLAFLVLAILPVVIALVIGGVGTAVLHAPPALVKNIAITSGGVALAAELLLLIYYSDTRYQNFDISQENTTQ